MNNSVKDTIESWTAGSDHLPGREALRRRVRRVHQDGAGIALPSHAPAEGPGFPGCRGPQGCKIRSGRDRIIRIIAIEIRSKLCRKSSKLCSAIIRNTEI